jgi:cytochrome oxidase Cu insertion factor (SCO1/SenC/PrrC family)
MRIRAFVVVLLLMWATCPLRTCDSAVAGTGQKKQQKATRYACPMDPEITSSKPGTCRKCGMALRLVPEKPEADGARSSSTPGNGSIGTPSISSSRIPDVRVYDENGKALRFYRDLVKGKTVAINFIFTSCTTICPPLTATFRKVQLGLTERADDIQLISISVDPTTDTPERLHEFAARFKAGPGWTFVTGNQVDINTLLRALGAAVADRNDHTPMILIGNDRTDYWTRSYGLSSPEALVRVIAEVAARK